MKTGYWSGVIVCGGLVISGCVRLDISRFPPEKPLVVGVDGWSSLALANEGARLREKFNLPVAVVPVHYWRRNLDQLRQAHEQGRPCILVGYSAGYHQSILTAEQCQKEGITIDLLVGIDPSYIADHGFYLPGNVKRVIFYFSTAKFDLMSWARGDEKRIREAKDSRVEFIGHLSCGHLDCLADPVLKFDLEKTVMAHSSVRLAKR